MATDKTINDEIPIQELIKVAAQMDKLRLTDETNAMKDLQQSDEKVVTARRAGEVEEVIGKIETVLGQRHPGDITKLLENIAEKGIEKSKISPLVPSQKPPVADP
ncbi:MAG: hypothetical protein AAB557_05630 [Patescibacteria group bacterium]